nr:asparagine synthase-related protein [Streptomyces sp. SID3343]
MPQVHPLEDRSVWRAVVGVRPDECLLLDGHGRANTARWWAPPAQTASFEEGACAVRQALIAAVDARTAAGGTVSADLSGGMDSTSLCFLAATGPARLLTTTWQGLDEANEDGAWARRAAAELPWVEHEFVGREHTPAWFADTAPVPAPAEEPGGWARDRAKLFGTLERMSRRGSRVHLCGGGGDQLFSPMPGHTHDLLRINPPAAFADLRRRTLFRREPLLPAIRALGDRTSFADHLARGADALAATSTPAGPRPSGWGLDARLPSWATPHARDRVALLLRRAAARDPQPLSPRRATHRILQEMRAGGDGTRRIDQLAQDILGIGYATPYTDDAVLAAVLAVRPWERVVATRYKPLLAAAVHGIVPAEILARSTKGEYTADAHAGLRRHRRDLLDLFEDSLLAEVGLIDADLLRAALHARPTHALHADLIPTLACEQWLRSLPTPGARPAPVAAEGTR